MNRQKTLINRGSFIAAVLAFGLAGPALAGDCDPDPGFTVDYHPTFAGTKITIGVGGGWFQDCFPQEPVISVDGNTITFELMANPECGICGNECVTWDAEATTPPLSPGEYTVNVAVFVCDEDVPPTWTENGTITIEQPTAHFHGLGDLAGGDFHSEARAVNTDGSVVAGQGFAGGYQAVRWTAAAGMDGITNLWSWAHADDLSADGSVAVGWVAGNTGGATVFRWSEQLGYDPIWSVEKGGQLAEDLAVSGDGSIVTYTTDGHTGSNEAIRWTETEGPLPLGTLPGGSASHAMDISADGSVIVGSGDTPQGNRPFRWTEADGMESLGQIDDGGGAATAVSADGSIIVGWAITGLFSSNPFRWTEADGYEFIVQGFMLPEDVSGDGAIMVGGDDLLSEPSAALMWHEGFTDGPRSVSMVLQDDYGLSLTGWTLQCATAISTDGSTIVGYGINPDGNTEAWRVALTTPQLGDLDGDGSVGTADLLQLIAAWGTCADCAEDLDDDDIVGTSDLLMLLANWG